MQLITVTILYTHMELLIYRVSRLGMPVQVASLNLNLKHAQSEVIGRMQQCAQNALCCALVCLTPHPTIYHPSRFGLHASGNGCGFGCLQLVATCVLRFNCF